MNLHDLLPYLCLFIGVCILILGFVIRIKLQNSERWPKTTGAILESTIQSEWAWAGGSRIYVVKPRVIYEYCVDGEKYTSSQLTLVEHNTADENLARRKSEKYSKGQQVDVYYNPRKPKFAVLEVGDPTHGKLPYGMTICGILLTVSGVVWLLVRQPKP